MAVDYVAPARAAILKTLKADVPYTTLVPKAQVYPATVPATPPWPFSRIAGIIASPFRASCLDSSAFRITVQAFSKGITTNDVLMLPAEDHILQIGSALKDALDQQILPFPTGEKLTLEWVQTVPQIDGDEAGAWMTSVVFNGDVSG